MLADSTLKSTNHQHTYKGHLHAKDMLQQHDDKESNILEIPHKCKSFPLDSQYDKHYLEYKPELDQYLLTLPYTDKLVESFWLVNNRHNQ
jgi:hypothetical protein